MFATITSGATDGPRSVILSIGLSCEDTLLVHIPIFKIFIVKTEQI